MDAIVTAGGFPEEDDPLYPFTKGESKALLEIAGRPMIQWVLDALDEAQKVERVVVVGLEREDRIKCDKLVAVVPNQGEMLENIRGGTRKVLEINPNAAYVLSVSSDIPAIRGEMADWTVGSALESQHDLYYSVIPKAVMESRFPHSRRSYVRLKDMDVCGGDMNVFRAELIATEGDMWERIIASRKNALKQAALIGYGTLFLLLLRRLTIQGAVKRAGKRLGIRGRALVSPYAEIGMDVDKPYQLELLRADLESRALV
jgi:GTP:adenosylcobinamide-phosphate guanylyltransferase